MRQKTSKSIAKISVALLASQKKIGAAKKGSVNPFYKSKFANLGEVMRVCKDILNDNKITVLQPVGVTKHGGQYVETVLLHESGEYIAGRQKLILNEKSSPQDQGKAISYAKRYSLQAMLFIPTEDDDAEGPMKTYRNPAPTKYSSKPSPKDPGSDLPF